MLYMGLLKLDFANLRATYSNRSAEILEHGVAIFRRYNCADPPNEVPKGGLERVLESVLGAA